jgi:hypothetical protein
MKRTAIFMPEALEADLPRSIDPIAGILVPRA